ncbi:MAG: hypothetical protein QM729_19600 [Solirubrobacterales bacterium]
MALGQLKIEELAPLAPLPVSAGHTPIYKLHRYFARRPHNQFAAIIERVSSPHDVILDCMAGGGVTLVEGLTHDRRVIAADINPIAALVQLGQVTEADPLKVRQAVTEILAGLPTAVRQWFDTTCEQCDEVARVRWFECSYVVTCPLCSEATTLTGERRAVHGTTGKSRPGRYVCESCHGEFAAVECRRKEYAYLSARVKCQCGHQFTRETTEADDLLARSIASQEDQLIERHGLRVPHDPIPEHWDRQVEDALARKGFDRFSDLFSPRNRLILAFLFRGLGELRSKLSDDVYIGVLTVLSSLIRYVNNMTVATAGWMDGRPVAWAKHAYWMPNQFVECNPFEYLEHRLKAYDGGARDRSARFQGKLRGDTAVAVIEGEADYSIERTDSRRLDIPDGTVAAVVTDPPFGSNVQYGELTELWSAWLGSLNPFAAPDYMDAEILMTRRRSVAPKTLDGYQLGLTEVFNECHRVLKDDGVLVFTFNNKLPDVWIAVMRAALDAGFFLADEDIAYQPEIVAYRDTAHLRFAKELQGDVLYTFRKGDGQARGEAPRLGDWQDAARELLKASVDPVVVAECRVDLHVQSLAYAASCLQTGDVEGARAWLRGAREVVTDARLWTR